MSRVQQYQPTVKIHNWYENQILDNVKTKTLQQAYNTNTLLSSKRSGLLQHTLQTTALSQSIDSLLYNNDSIMLYAYGSKGVLSVDINESLNIASNYNNTHNYLVTTSTLTPAHVRRNTFTIELMEDNTQTVEYNKPVQYHQRFRLVCHNELSAEKLYLASILKTHLNCSKQSKQQCVYVTNNVNDYNTQWQCELADVQYRYEAENTPIHITQACLFIHCATQQPLYSSAQYSTLNTYGNEFEVTCHYKTTTGKVYQLHNESHGRTSVEASQKQHAVENVWCILMDDDSTEQPKSMEEQKTQ